MKQALQQALDALMPYKSTVLREYTVVDQAIDACRKALEKRPTCYVCAIDLEELKKPGVRLVEVSNVEFDAWTVPLYRWG